MDDAARATIESVDEHQSRRSHEAEVWREGFGTSLYVAMCLLAALAATDDDSRHVLYLIWGTTIGVMLAHWIAFRVSSRLMSGGVVRKEDTQLAVAQVFGGGGIALLTSVAIVILPASREREVARLFLAAYIAFIAYAVARSAKASPGRAVAYSLFVSAMAFGVAVIKNLLSPY